MTQIKKMKIKEIELLNKINLIRKAPARTPVVISYKIRNLIKNKVVCELGCAEGDNLILMSKYAKEVIGLDIDKKRLKHAQKRDLNVQLLNYRLDMIQKAEVYYFWPSNSLRDTPYLFWKIINNSYSNSIIISGCDNSVKYDKLCSYIYSIFSDRFNFNYHEGSRPKENGKFSINILYKSKLLFYHYPFLFFLTYFLRTFSYLRNRLAN